MPGPTIEGKSQGVSFLFFVFVSLFLPLPGPGICRFRVHMLQYQFARLPPCLPLLRQSPPGSEAADSRLPLQQAS